MLRTAAIPYQRQAYPFLLRDARYQEFRESSCDTEVYEPPRPKRRRYLNLGINPCMTQEASLIPLD